MLTPKEKAKELVDRFNIDLKPFSEYGHWDIMFAKKCAKIAVEECLHTCVESSIYYWKEVLTEIENL